LAEVVSVDSAVAGRRGGLGRLPGAGGGAGDSTSGGGSSVIVVAGGVEGTGMGAVSSGGGALTEGEAARTICLFAHPAIDKETKQSSPRNLNFRTRASPQKPCRYLAAGKELLPFGEPVANRFEKPCRVQLRTQILWNRCATEPS